MSKIYKYNGKILKKNNKIANSEDCCCSCGTPHCSNLPNTFNSNITFTAPYLQQYLPLVLNFNSISAGVWTANSVLTPAGCPSVSIAFTYYCNLISDAFEFDCDLTSDSFLISYAIGDLNISADINGPQFDTNCDIVIPNFEITINDATFGSFLFLDHLGACAN